MWTLFYLLIWASAYDKHDSQVPNSYSVMKKLLSIELNKLTRSDENTPHIMKEEALSHMFNTIPYNHIYTTEDEKASTYNDLIE